MENLFFVIIVIFFLLLAIAVFISYIKDQKKQKDTFKKNIDTLDNVSSFASNCHPA